MCIRSSGRPHYWNMAALEREIPVGFVAYSCNMRFCIRIANYEKYVVWTLIDKIWAQLNWNFRRLIDMKVNIFLLVFARSEGRQFECGLVAILLGPTMRSYISLHSIKCTVFLFLCLLWGFQKALDSYFCCLFFFFCRISRTQFKFRDKRWTWEVLATAHSNHYIHYAMAVS